MKRKNMDQKEYGYTHTRDRLIERYGLKITREEYNDLCEQVRDQRDVMITGKNLQKKGIQFVLKTKFKGETIVVVWENNRDCITTVLPGGGNKI